MRRIVPDFIQPLLKPPSAPPDPLPVFSNDNWTTRPGFYRAEYRQPGVDYIWLEYAMDVPEVTVSLFDIDQSQSATIGVLEADSLRRLLDRAGWTQQFHTSHKEGYSYLFGRQKSG